MEGNSIDSSKRKGLKRTIDKSQNAEEGLVTKNDSRTSDHEESEGCTVEYDDEGTEECTNVDHEYIAQEEGYSKLKSARNENTNVIICSPHESFDTLKSTWTRAMTQVLIEEYRKMVDEFRNPYKKQKDLWYDLANNMCRRGFDVTWDMCDRKWRNLKHSFKTIYFSRHRSQNSKRRWEFYTELEEFFVPQGNDEMLRKSRTDSPVFDEGEPDILTKGAVIVKPSKIPRISKTTTSPVTYAQILDMSSIQDSVVYPQIILCDRGGESAAKATNSNKGASSSRTSNGDENASESAPHWFRQFLKEYRKDEDKRLALFKEMHSESMQVERRKCAVLEGILKRLT